MAVIMKCNATLASLAFIGSGALAQDVTTLLATNSALPEGASHEFCYYGGLAYSQNSYLPIGVPSQGRVTVAAGTADESVEAQGGNVRYILLQCVDAASIGREECSKEGLAWAVRQNTAFSPRIEQ